MEAVKFKPELHYLEMAKWSRGHGSNLPSLSLFPENGWVVPGFCAMFLYMTDSGVAFMENLISNPDAPYSLVSPALDACIAATLQGAKDLGVQFVWGTTFIPGVVGRARQHGFRVMPQKYKLMAKGLL